MILVHPFQLKYAKSSKSAIFVVHHPELQILPIAVTLAIERSEEMCYPVTTSNVESSKSQQKGSKGRKVGKGIAGESAGIPMGLSKP